MAPVMTPRPCTFCTLKKRLATRARCSSYWAFLTWAASLLPLAKDLENCTRRQLSRTICCSRSKEFNAGGRFKSMGSRENSGCSHIHGLWLRHPKSLKNRFTVPNHVPLRSRWGHWRGLAPTKAANVVKAWTTRRKAVRTHSSAGLLPSAWLEPRVDQVV